MFVPFINKLPREPVGVKVCGISPSRNGTRKRAVKKIYMNKGEILTLSDVL